MARDGVEETALLSGYRAEQLEKKADYCRGLDLRVVPSVAPGPAGTAGPLAYACDLLAQP